MGFRAGLTFWANVFTFGGYSQAANAVSETASTAANALSEKATSAYDATRDAAKKVAETAKRNVNYSDFAEQMRQKQLLRRGYIESEQEQKSNRLLQDYKREIKVMIATLELEVEDLHDSTFAALKNGEIAGKQRKIDALKEMIKCETFADFQHHARQYQSNRAVVGGLFSHRTRDIMSKIINEQDPISVLSARME